MAFALHILGHAAVANGKIGVRRDVNQLPQGAVDQAVACLLKDDHLAVATSDQVVPDLDDVLSDLLFELPGGCDQALE